MANKIADEVYIENLNIAFSRVVTKGKGVKFTLKDLFCNDEWCEIDRLGIQRVLGEKFKAIMESQSGDIKVCDRLGIEMHTNKTENDNYRTQEYTRK
jgi:hypothetical protein